MAINFIAGPKCSGVGLIESAIKKSKTKSVVNISGLALKIQKEVNESLIYIVESNFILMEKFKERSLLIIRCPATALLCFLELKSFEAERYLTDDEFDYYVKSFTNAYVSVNTLINSGVNFFAIRNEERCLERLSQLTVALTGEENLVTSDELNAFFDVSINRQIFKTFDDLPKSHRIEAQRLGTMYEKLGLRLEAW